MCVCVCVCVCVCYNVFVLLFFFSQPLLKKQAQLALIQSALTTSVNVLAHFDQRYYILPFWITSVNGLQVTPFVVNESISWCWFAI